MTGRSFAAAQTVPVRGDVAANVDEHLRLARLAALEGARVLVFPELSLTGYELDLARERALAPADPRLAPLREAARSLSLALVVGAPARVGAELRLGAFLVLPDGSLHLYAKRHLGAFPPSAAADAVPGGAVPPPEASVFAPGDRPLVFPLGEDRAALAVCADTGRPSHPREAAALGATAYLASMFVIPGDFDAETENLRGHAARHGMLVVFANYGGPTGGLASAGGSAIWSERGEPLARLGSAGAGIVVAARGEEGWTACAIPADGASGG